MCIRDRFERRGYKVLTATSARQGLRIAAVCSVAAVVEMCIRDSDFPYQQFYPEKATIIQVDIRGEQIGRRTKVDLGVVGDVKTTLRALLPHLPEKTDDQHISASIQHYQKARTALDDGGSCGRARTKALSHPGPALVEVVVDRQELALPPLIKLAPAKGFSLFMMRP